MSPTKGSAADTVYASWSAASPGAGEIDFPSWETAKPIYLSYYWSGADAPEGRQATVRVLWSSEALHVLFECNQREPLVVEASPQTSHKTIGLWDRDVCEVFLAPDPGARNHYFEFEAAPTGEWLDGAIHLTKKGKEANWGFHSGLSVSARCDATRLLISMRIPWSVQIPKPLRASSWRANFFRCIGSGKDRGYVAWRPTKTAQPSFHVPSAFGWLEFT